MNYNNKISLFSSYRDTIPAMEISMEDFCANVISGDYRDEVLGIRDLTVKAERDRIKATLPAVTISGTFTRRGNAYLKQHSGFICVDIDGHHNPQVTDWERTRDSIGNVNQVLFCALSVSGKGCFAIIPIAYPDRHHEHFQSLRRDFHTAWGLTIDNTPDVARLRGISYDPGATWQPDAADYSRLYIPEKPQPRTYTPVNGDRWMKLRQWLENTVGIHFAPGSRNVYVAHLAAAAHRLGISQGETEAELVRFAASDFPEKEILRTIQSIYKNETWIK